MPAHDAISNKEKATLILSMGSVGMAFYYLLNSYPLFEPRDLPLTFIDQAIPFLLWTTWPYILLLLGNFVLPFLIHNRKHFIEMMMAFAIAVSINIIFWAFWPTTFPRPESPGGDGWTEQLYLLLISVDSPLNCFPSGHITVPTIQVWALTRGHGKTRWWLWPLLVLLGFSILSTKQHYFWDMLGGWGSASIGIMTALWWSKRRNNLS
jgi:membrane-associated phospholipid phosphatase